MAYTPRTRDRYRLLVSAVSGLTTVGVVAATGAVTGLAAEQTARRDAARAQAAEHAGNTHEDGQPRAAPCGRLEAQAAPHRGQHPGDPAGILIPRAGWVDPGLPGPSPAAPHPGARRPTRGRRRTPTTAPSPQPPPPTPAPTSGS